MIPPQRPANEDERLAHLRALSLLDTPAEERFDRITRLARGLFDVPIALISLVDDERQWFKSKQGLTDCETSRESSFCGHAILQPDLLVVEDALLDERFHDNPLVVGGPKIRFYAGYPLQDADGLRLGTLCLIDVRPRAFHSSARELLRDLGCMAATELGDLRLGLTQLEQVGWQPTQGQEQLDPITGTWNGASMLEIVGHGIERGAREGRAVSLVVARMNDNGLLFDTWARTGAAILLAEAAQALRRSVRSHDAIGTLGGRFLVLMMGCGEEEARQRVARLELQIGANSVLQSLGIAMSFGVATSRPESEETSAAELLRRAQAAFDAPAAVSLGSRAS